MRFCLAILFALTLTTAALAQVRPPATPPVARPVPAVSDTTPESQTPLHLNADRPTLPAPKSTSLAAQIINTLLNLALVIGLAYLAMLGVKKYMSGSLRAPGAPGSPPKRALRVLETLSLCQGRAVYLVAAGDRLFLVGASAQHVSLVSEVTGDATLAAALAHADNAAPGPFAAILARALPPESPKEQS